MSTFDRAVPAGERDAILAQACARNLPIEVSVAGRVEPAALRSRFLKTGDLTAGDPIVIEVPTQSGSSVMVHPEEVLEVLLMVGGQRYGFRSRVKSRGRMHLGGEVEVSTIALEYPRRVVKLQRRRFYRVKVPGLEPPVVHCIAKRPERTGEGDAPKGDDVFTRFEGVAADISSGGIALKVPPKSSHLVKIGHRVALLFELQGYTNPIRLLAEVKHTRTVQKTGAVIAGMQFVDWHKTLPGRKAINYITRYVVKRQREELKRKSGLE